MDIFSDEDEDQMSAVDELIFERLAPRFVKCFTKHLSNILLRNCICTTGMNQGTQHNTVGCVYPDLG